MATGEDVVISPLVQALLDKLCSNLLIDFGLNWGVEDELRDLCKILQLIYEISCVAEEMQMKDTCLKIFLREIRDVVYSATYTMDEFIYESHRQCLEDESNLNISRTGSGRKVREYINFSFNKQQILHKYEIPSVINDLKKKMAEIEEKIKPNYLNLISSDKWELDVKERRLQTVSSLDKRQESVSFVDESDVFGREEDAKEMIKILLSDQYDNKKIYVISIVGIGGIGKTTLAQLIYNHPNVVKHFQMRAWVCVSEDFNAFRLSRKILESATRKECNISNLDLLQCELRDALRGKRLLLVLDDIWSVDHKTWNALKVSFSVADKGSRIIVTTRFKSISSITGAIKTLELKLLPNKDCWELFKKKAFDEENFGIDPRLEEIGKRIVEKCKGLPLAINTLGGLLCNESDVKKWDLILKSEMWEVEGDETLPALRLSYHYLPAHLKLCFAYCSLFPKDYRFDKKTLILFWIAEGFIPSKQVDIIEDLGSKYFDELLNRSFFQKYSDIDESIFLMHDMMHDLAELVSKDKYYRLEKGKSHNTISEKVHCISMVSFQPEPMEMELYKYKDLSTFILLQRSWFLKEEEVLHGPRHLIEQFGCLRVLDLSGINSFNSLPDSIGNLKHLRLLNLNWTGIQVLPESLCNIYNLQILMLNGCVLDEFPENMGNLISLQHIEMGDNIWGEQCNMWNKFTQRGIGRLCFLKTLRFFNVRKKNDNDGSTIGELKDLCHVRDDLHVLGLENVSDIEKAKRANLMNKYQITKLILEWSSNFDGNFLGNGASAESVLEGLQPSTKLRCLSLHHYGGSSFPNWMMKEFQHYDMLVHIQLYGCKNCTFLPAFGNLPSLKYLYMHGMKEVEYMGKEFYGYRDNNNNYKGFQMLELLCIQKMKSLRGWWGAEEGEFPCLKELSIGCCPNLVKLPHLLPSVEEVDIRACSVLTYLPMLPSTSRLSLENCDGRILSCMHNCPSLSKLEIRNFPNTTFLPPAILHPLAKTLETLKIWCFQSLLSLPKGLQDLAILQNLEIYNCNMLQSLPDLQALASLRRLEIRGCESLAYLPKGLNKLTSFQELIIEWTNKMTPVLEEGVGLQDLASLPKLKIYKSSLSSFLPKGLNKLTSLQELTIYWSKNTKSISEEKLPSSLHSLTIWKCPEEIKSRLQEGGEDWPKIAHIPSIQLYSMQHSSSR